MLYQRVPFFYLEKISSISVFKAGICLMIKLHKNSVVTLSYP